MGSKQDYKRATDIIEDVMSHSDITQYRIDCLLYNHRIAASMKLADLEKQVNRRLASRKKPFRVIIKRKDSRLCLITKRGLDEA